MKLKSAHAGLVGLAFLHGTLPPAGAAERSLSFEPGHHSFESPQNFAFELRFAPYRPEIDDEGSLQGRTPYHDTFGTMPRLLIAAEFDWQAIRIPHLGTIGPGVSVGYTNMGAKAQKADGSGPSAEDTSLDIFPFYGVAVLRADALMRDFGIPLVPYAKAGVGYALWRASNSGGTSEAPSSTGESVAGKGHTWGTHFALGVSLDLNTFDETAARGFDNSMGVNHTYLFVEFVRYGLTGLGQTAALEVASSTWAAGLAFEF